MRDMFDPIAPQRIAKISKRLARINKHQDTLAPVVGEAAEPFGPMPSQIPLRLLNESGDAHVHVPPRKVLSLLQLARTRRPEAWTSVSGIKPASRQEIVAHVDVRARQGQVTANGRLSRECWARSCAQIWICACNSGSGAAHSASAAPSSMLVVAAAFAAARR